MSLQNINEYFSSHYLESTLAGDIKAVVAAWRTRGADSPPRRLAALSQMYFRAKADAIEIPKIRRRSGKSTEIARWHSLVLQSLGYEGLSPAMFPVEGGSSGVPILGRVDRYGSPWLVIAETPFCLPESALPDGVPDEIPLEQLPVVDLVKDPIADESNAIGSTTKSTTLTEGTWSRCLSRILTAEDAPRWAILLSGSQIALFDRNTFSQGRYLVIDLDDAYGRKDRKDFDIAAAMLSRETLCPHGTVSTENANKQDTGDGQPAADEVLLDRIEENSHRFAHGVTDSLQTAVREAIEILVNEWARDRRERQKLNQLKIRADEFASLRTAIPDLQLDLPTTDDGGYEITAEHLRREALTYVYRLLFCFYAEARGEDLSILPIRIDAYRLGYSLEALRDLEQVPLTPATEDGTYFDQHLDQLFRLIHEGFHPNHQADNESGRQLALSGELISTFRIRPLTATLFDPSATPLLGRARLRNLALQSVIKKLSLSESDRSRSIGRVDYGQLGINQLGAVYEGLLSYQGMFADQELIQVKPSGKRIGDKKTPTWFVPKDRLSEFAADEVQREGNVEGEGQVVVYPKGHFILHLSGIDREQSASYYTPEVLTRCLVTEALRELLDGYTPEDADKILQLKILEPAMGSGAFLGEAAAQLAAKYLELKQQQLASPRANPRSPLPASDDNPTDPRSPLPASDDNPTDPRSPLPASDDNLTNPRSPLPASGRGAGGEGSPRALLQTSNFTLQTSIAPEHFADELRRVKHYIATRNVYGVDLNATAVQLGQLSLWLGSVHRLNPSEDETARTSDAPIGATPWFGLRLRHGNSLVGARRAVWTRAQLKSGQHVKKNSKHLAPRLLAPGESRGDDEVYHFLVLDEEMVPTHRDTLMRRFHPTRCETAKTWITRQAKPKWTDEQIKAAIEVSKLVDQQFATYARERIAALAATDCTASVWPMPADDPAATDPGPSLAEQERAGATLERDSGAFQRLRMVMDTWCALWFWPLSEVDNLPAREALLESSRMLLSGTPLSSETASGQMTVALANMRLGFDIDLLKNIVGDGVPDVHQLSEVVPWFGVAEGVRTEQAFHHWELAFPEVLGESANKGGFDLIVGNPPWIKASWSDGSVLAELQPMLGVKEAKSAALNRARDTVLADDDGTSTQANIASGSRSDKKQCPRCFYVDEFRKQEGVATFLNSPRLYPELVGMKANLYKNFIVRSWGLSSKTGSIGLLHPEGPYDDASGGQFRKAIYPRLRGHYHHKNELQLFSDVDHHTDYSINIYGPLQDSVSFHHMSNLFHPSTVAASFGHDREHDPIPGIKDSENKWNVRPHSKRIVDISANELAMFALLLEDDDVNPLTSRLPQVHSRPLVNVIEKITKAPQQLGDHSTEYFATQMYNEVNAQREGAITRQEDPAFEPTSPDDWVVSGPHFFVGTPFNKTPRGSCTHNNAYDDIDLTVIPTDYLPRAVYRPGDESGDRAVFTESVPCWPPHRLPGLWPVPPENEAAWEVLLGEPPIIHTAADDSRVIHIESCTNDTRAAIAHLSQLDAPTRADLTDHFPNAQAKQSAPPLEALENLNQPITTRYRYANRRRISIGTERTLISSLFPIGMSHIHPVLSITFNDYRFMTTFQGVTSSLPIDFIIRCTGKADLYESTLSTLPIPTDPIASLLINRTLRLNCLTSAYADLWTSVADGSMLSDSFTVPGILTGAASPLAGRGDIPTGPMELAFADLDPGQWTWNTPLRSDRARRQALLEIDVLVAMSLGLTLEELLQIYQVQFPVMRMYEQVDEYDTHGRHLPNTKRKNQGGTETRTARADATRIHGEAYAPQPAEDFFDPQCHVTDPSIPPLSVTWPINNDTETVTRDFHPPFFKVDREDDYRRAWEAFEQRISKGEKS
jgi:hypothetical protein